jgi:Patatin-like phospholipase
MAGGPRSDIVEAEVALCDELDEIERRRQNAGVGYDGPGNPCGETLAERASRLGLTALCLSGGGIRSAAFSLGVLQSLAKQRLLNEFDYLSTVSGGGFIGGWLQMLIKESGDIQRAQEVLEKNSAPPIRRLRAFTNYLTPQTGPFSVDTWGAIVLYLRNLILNWMVFTPLFLLLALAPIFYRTSLASMRGCHLPILGGLMIATASVVWTSWQACCLIPSHRTHPPGFVASRVISRRIALPSLVWAFFAPLVINDEIARGQANAWTIPSCYAAAMLAGYGIAWASHTDRSKAGTALYRENALRWVYATACGFALTALAIYLIQPDGPVYHIAAFRPATGGPPLLADRESALAAFGPIWFMGTHVLQTTFYVAFRKEALHADLDREWLGRLSGILLLIGTGWTAFAVSCLILPVMLHFVPSSDTVAWHPLYVAITGGGSTVAGAFGAWFGKKLSSEIETLMGDSGKWTRWLPNTFSVVFAVGIFACSSSVLQHSLGQFTDAFYVNETVRDPQAFPWLKPLSMQLGLALVLTGFAFCFARVNVNRYSMHAIYRNRLVRAFLGSAREQRRPDPFTGFDPDDNPHLIEFAKAASRQRLFPVINMTLNVTAGSNTAWAERKAECFTATPLACGSATLRHPSQRRDQSPPLGAFVATKIYAGMEGLGNKNGRDRGPYLGSLLTISGATVSPNWGYHSSRLTAFVMTLFNVRLGAWLPNPANATLAELQLAKPRNSELALLSELLGAATDTSQAIYLSDGGHFENLGVYEMLRRRCRRIVVVDAGQDGDGRFSDLGNAIRKARIDLDVEVKMRPMRIFSREKIEKDSAASVEALGIALGEVTYPDSGIGHILYLKPSFLTGIPADVRAYGASDGEFPFNNILQQWFTESQFESYRALGRWQMDQLDGASLQDLFESAEKMLKQNAAGADHS